MSTDFRSLCAEMLTAWQVGDDIAGPMNRARRLLAQPEPVAPTDDNLRGIFCRFCDEGDNGPPWIESEEFIQAARAVLARWGTPANTINQEDYDRG